MSSLASALLVIVQTYHPLLHSLQCSGMFGGVHIHVTCAALKICSFCFVCICLKASAGHVVTLILVLQTGIIGMWAFYKGQYRERELF